MTFSFVYTSLLVRGNWFSVFKYLRIYPINHRAAGFPDRKANPEDSPQGGGRRITL